MAALEVLPDDGLPVDRPERLDREELALLHLVSLAAALYDGHGLPRVDLIGPDRVPVEVADRLHGVGLAVELDLVRLHHLLHCGADIAQPDVDSRLPDSGVCRLLDRGEQRFELGIERHGERAVDDAPADVRAKV